MKILYIDINTGAYRFARFHSTDSTLNQHILKGKGGKLFRIGEWQLVARIPCKNKKKK